MHTVRRTGSISASELSASLRDYVVADVRPVSEWNAGHIPGSKSARSDDIDASWIDADPRFPVALIADDTAMAETVAARLRARGRDAVVLEGGYSAWGAAGGCIVQSHPRIG